MNKILFDEFCLGDLKNMETMSRMKMYARIFTMILLVFLLNNYKTFCENNYNASQATTYYIDSVNGNDLNDGTSNLSPWKSIAKVNLTVFQPGDKILFKAGGIWVGKLNPKGSGTEGNPIVIDKYDSGSKPLIIGNGSIGDAVVYLFNQEYWEINNLEITNDASSPGDRRGVQVAASNYGTVNHIHLKNLLIHNIKGIADQSAIEAKRTGGIGVETLDDSKSPTRFNDILIEGCEIYSVDNTGLYTDNRTNVGDYPKTPDWEKRKFTNVRIRNNVIHDVAKNAMIIRMCDGGIVEYNLCYDTAYRAITGNTIFSRSCDGTIFQYNEGYLNRSRDYDGSMYDADLQSPNTIWQYSYSHDNAHGLFWTCTVQADSGVICRYNISQNDKGIIFCINYPANSVYCYNNTVYSDASVSPTIISERNNGGSGTRKYYFINNIIYNSSATAKYDFRTSGYNRIIDYNVFFGQHPNNEPSSVIDKHKLTTDPMLVRPGSGGEGLNSLDGYKLKEKSPCINSGYKLFNHSQKDFWGNPVPDKNGTIDRGANEYNNNTTFLRSDQVPGKFQLRQNYPNPFNPRTNIEYDLPISQLVTLTIYDSLGRSVANIVKEYQSAGKYKYNFDASRLASGIYYCQLRTNGIVQSKKMIYLR